MTVHELKDEIKYFEMTQLGKKGFEIRKNDRDYQVDDGLILRATDNGVYVFKQEIGTFNSGRFRWKKCRKAEADIIKAKVTCVLSSLEVNEGIDFMNFKLEVSLFEDEALPFVKAGWRNDWDYEYFLKVLKDYFHTDRLPDDYVILGIEVEK